MLCTLARNTSLYNYGAGDDGDAKVDELLMSLQKGTDKKIVFFFQSIFSLRKHSFL